MREGGGEALVREGGGEEWVRETVSEGGRKRGVGERGRRRGVVEGVKNSGDVRPFLENCYSALILPFKIETGGAQPPFKSQTSSKYQEMFYSPACTNLSLSLSLFLRT